MLWRYQSPGPGGSSAVQPLASRRQCLRWGLSGAGALAAGAALAPLARAAAPVSGSGVILLRVGGNTTPLWVEIQNRSVEPFLAQHPGVRIQWVPNGTAAQIVTDTLAGDVPDVLSGYHPGMLIQGHAALDIAPYARASNVDFRIWNQSVVDAWRDGSALYGIPDSPNVYGMIVNIGTLNDLGLKLPSPDWDYQEAEALWRAATSVTAKQHVYGGAILQNSGTVLPASVYLHGFGGAYVDPTNRARCTADSPASLQALEWAYGLNLDGVAWMTTSSFPNQYAKGLAVCDMFGIGSLPQLAASFRGQEWDFWPTPRLPQGAFNDMSPGAWFVSSITRQPQVAWDLIYYFASARYPQRLMMKVALSTPSSLDLWPEYVGTVIQYAPPLRNKNLSVLPQLAASGVVRRTFEYLPAGATDILSKAGQDVLNKTASVTEAFTAATKEVNAMQASASVYMAQQAKVAGLLGQAAAAAKAVSFPAPATTGAGSPPTQAAKGAVTVHHGSYTLVGSGHGLSLALNDAFTIACAPWTSSLGTFTCRLTSIASVGGPPSSGAKVGLMARGDLSSTSPLITVAAAINRGVHVWDRGIAEIKVADQSGFGGPPVLPESGLLLPRQTSPQPRNYLLKPVWFRLVRDVEKWTAWTSFDGTHWSQAGTTAGIQMAGCWVGIWASNNGGNDLRCVFDHLSFMPVGFYQVGG